MDPDKIFVQKKRVTILSHSLCQYREKADITEYTFKQQRDISSVLLLQVLLLLLPPECIHVFSDFRVCSRVVQARVTPGSFNLHMEGMAGKLGGVCVCVCVHLSTCLCVCPPMVRSSTQSPEPLSVGSRTFQLGAAVTSCKWPKTDLESSKRM